MASDENAGSFRDKYGTGDFPDQASIKEMSKQTAAGKGNPYTSVSRKDFHFGIEERDEELSPTDKAQQQTESNPSSGQQMRRGWNASTGKDPANDQWRKTQ